MQSVGAVGMELGSGVPNGRSKVVRRLSHPVHHSALWPRSSSRANLVTVVLFGFPVRKTGLERSLNYTPSHA
jgi:hypothetical protein